MALILLLTLLLSIPSYAVTQWCDHVNNVGCFLMEDSGNETDRGGNTSNTLTETSGTIPQSVDEKFGTYSRDFEAGETEYLAHADSLETDISGADATLSIMSWAKLETGGSSDQFIMSKFGSSNIQYGISINGNEVAQCYFSAASDNGGSYERVLTDQGALDEGTWYHLTCVYDDTNKIIYRNGVATSSSKTDGIFDGNQEFKFGSRDGARYWDGLIDDGAIFDTALDSTDINDIMDNGLVQAAASTRRIMVIQ